jgi:alpha-tubulin suppressor-like RCC1 family protein
LDANELCDGSSLGKATCQTLNFDDGQLGCAVDCRSYDTSSCALKTQLSVGHEHACVRFQDGRIKCWGSNFLSGALGLGDKVDRGVEVGTMGDALPFVDVGAVAKRVYAGYSQTCALLIDDSLVCWGANDYGELGVGDTRYRGDDPGETGAALRAVDLGTGRHATQVTMGDSHVCAILDNQQLKCWGFNGYGTLGVGDRQNRGDDPNEMGDALPAIDLGTGRHAVTVRAGRTHTCAILDNYTIKCWGDNAFGELGLGDNTNRGWAPNQMGDELPSVDLGTSARPLALVVGGVFSCAVLEDSKMKCWGWNGSGQLGQSDTTPRGWQPNQMGSQLPYTDLGSGLSIAEISATGSERAHACALFTSGAIKCWGANTAGVLGLGDTADRGDNPNEMGDALPFLDLGPKKVVSIGTGIGHACALLDDETVRCWGNPNHGVLGLADGEYNSIGDQPGEMGINLRPVELL